MMYRLSILLPLLALMLHGCGGGSSARDSAPAGYPDLSHTPDAVPKVERISRSNQRPYKVFGRSYQPMRSSAGYVEKGVASWYGNKFHGNRTANGEHYDMYAMSAAHKYLPLPTYVQVRNLENGRTAVVRVNDRGPFHGNRVIDLSYAAASKLGMLRKGTALVEVRAIDPRHPQQAQRPPAPSKPVKLGSAHSPRIYLQVGAFGDAANAERLKSRLEQYLKRPVRVESVQNQGRTLHRVQIGPLASVDIADKVTDSLETINIYQTHLLLR
jgi:rare lipoprotein A